MLEKWRNILDNKGYSETILVDLSKAFDTINHELLLAKLHAYGFSEQALLILSSYLKSDSHVPENFCQIIFEKIP